MRSSVRKRRSESEEESVFVSMTDMTVSFLFIVIILLAFFASQVRPDETIKKEDYEEVVRQRDEVTRKLEILENSVVRKDEVIAQQAEEIEALEKKVQLLESREINAVEEYAKAVDREKRQIITNLKERVEKAVPEVKIEISTSGDILRFQGDSFFATGKDRIRSRQMLDVVHALAEGLEELLPCFTLGTYSRRDKECNRDSVLVDTVQIEGHTDDRGLLENNLSLSLRRGATTYLEIGKHRPRLLDYLNFNEESVLSVSGYGETRPLETNKTGAGRGKNRRIDLRLIMSSAKEEKEIKDIREKLDNLADSALRKGETQ